MGCLTAYVRSAQANLPPLAVNLPCQTLAWETSKGYGWRCPCFLWSSTHPRRTSAYVCWTHTFPASSSYPGVNSFPPGLSSEESVAASFTFTTRFLINRMTHAMTRSSFVQLVYCSRFMQDGSAPATKLIFGFVISFWHFEELSASLMRFLDGHSSSFCKNSGPLNHILEVRWTLIIHVNLL